MQLFSGFFLDFFFSRSSIFYPLGEAAADQTLSLLIFVEKHRFNLSSWCQDVFNTHPPWSLILWSCPGLPLEGPVHFEKNRYLNAPSVCTCSVEGAPLNASSRRRTSLYWHYVCKTCKCYRKQRSKNLLRKRAFKKMKKNQYCFCTFLFGFVNLVFSFFFGFNGTSRANEDVTLWPGSATRWCSPIALSSLLTPTGPIAGGFFWLLACFLRTFCTTGRKKLETHPLNKNFVNV